MSDENGNKIDIGSVLSYLIYYILITYGLASMIRDLWEFITK